MISAQRFTTNLACRLAEVTHRSLILPLVIYYPTSRCNSRCVSCDWWRSTGSDDLSLDEVGGLVASLGALRTTRVAFSGGEPLVRPDLRAVAELFRQRGIRLELLTSGVLLDAQAADVAACFERVTVSLDGADDESYEAVRGVRGLSRVEQGLRRLKDLAPGMQVTARATLHALNFRELPRLMGRARAIGVDHLSFLAADVTSSAFGRHGAGPLHGLLLSASEVDEFGQLVEETIAHHSDAFASGYIVESPDKLRRLPRYYAAMLGHAPFPPVDCNAPWVSVVVEADGAVRPCFFHPPVGNVRAIPLEDLVRKALPRFRRALDVATDPICERCVCSLKVGLRSRSW